MTRFDKLLVLDMDETLVHADERLVHHEFVVGPYRVVRRPHVARFLAFVFEHFAAVGVWTAASRGFAEPVLDQLLDRRRLEFLWCADRCSRSCCLHGPQTKQRIEQCGNHLATSGRKLEQAWALCAN